MLNEIEIFTNRNSKQDFICNAFNKYIKKAETVYIAVAFFTNIKVMKTLKENNCQVKIIVRLGFPTSPDALHELLKMENVQVRFYTDSTFHPKLYIFGTSDALLGSANLTNTAFNVNQELMIHIDDTFRQFTDILQLFDEYWDNAKVLNQNVVDDYMAAYNSSNIDEAVMKIDKQIIDKIGRVSGNNINRGKKKPDPMKMFIDSFSKTYQECVNAFNIIREIYTDVGKRKVDESKIPLRLEIDSFISFVRGEFASGDSWEKSSISSGNKQKDIIREKILEWHKSESDYFENDIVNIKYPKLINVFSSIENVRISSEDDIFEALCTVHSFHDRRRFFEGGLPALRSIFFGNNDLAKIKNVLSYLIFGSDDIILRMAKLIFDNDFKLYEFGRANVQELIGWINNKELPIINGRTTKILRYFGFDIKQL